jgi:two-component system phosphate regulon sensor histidine kinase PhoR
VTTLIAFALGTALAAVWISRRRLESHVRHLARLSHALAHDQPRESFVFHRAPEFMRMALDLEAISDERRKLRKIADEEKFNLVAILTSIADGLMVVDETHTIQLANDAFTTLFPEVKNPVGQTVLSTLRNAEIQRLVAASIEFGEQRSAEIVLEESGHEPKQFILNALPLRRQDGTISGAVTVFHDVSRLRQLEEVRKEFVANVSHELRTPLAIFQGYIETLLDDPTMPRAELHDVLQIMQRHSQRLNALLQDLLALARLEARQEKLQLQPVALEPFLHQIAADWKNIIAAKDVSLTVDVAPGLAPVELDPQRMEQVINNLLDNAIKFTPGGGRVIVRANAEPNGVNISIEDTGGGVPPRDLPHIFERFYRVEKARTRNGGGTGLGLSIVKHIVALHGGSVTAKNEASIGLAITVRFPRGDFSTKIGENSLSA